MAVEKPPADHVVAKSTDGISDSEAGGAQVTVSASDNKEVDTSDPNVVEFEENDPENPLNWSAKYKWALVVLLSAMSMLDTFATITIIPAVPQVLEEFKVQNDLYSVILVSVWELGEGLGPFLVAPLSEIYGRLLVYHIGNFLFVLFSLASALSTNISMLIAFRFFNGFVTTSLTLGPSIISDLFAPEERGTAMALALLFPLVGPVCAPIVGSFTAQAKGWRWTIWNMVIAVGFVFILSVIFFRETYKVTILERKAKRLRKSTGNDLLYSKHDTVIDRSFWIQSLARPLKLLFLSPIVTIVSTYTAVAYGISYIVLTTITPIFENTHGFSQGSVGLVFLGEAIGMIIAIAIYATCSDRYLKYRQLKDGATEPESRLPFMVLGAIVLPIGFFIYGWTLAYRTHWITPLVGAVLIGMSMLLTILPTENYLADVYDLYSASAIGAGVILRSLSGAVVPLAGPPIYASLGYGWGNSLLAFISVVFVPPLIYLVVYGKRMRESPRFLVKL